MMKKIFFLFKLLMGIILLYFLYLMLKPLPSTPEVYDLNEKEKKFHINMVKYGKSAKSAQRLSQYYRYTVKDSNQSLYWLRYGALLGSPSMQYNLGQKLLYSSSQKDIQKGLKWLKQSAKNNCQWAQCELGLLYKEGLKIDKNILKSNYYYNLVNGKNKCDGRVLKCLDLQ